MRKRWEDPTIEDQVRFVSTLFGTMEATAKLENGTETHTITTKQTNNQRRVKRQRCQGACYDRIDETQLIHKADS
jgi:hypothetical protein